MGRGTGNSHFFHRTHTDGPQHERSEKRKSKPQYITAHLSQGLPSKRQRRTSVGEDVEKREPLYTVGRIVNSCSHHAKHYGDSSKN